MTNQASAQPATAESEQDDAVAAAEAAIAALAENYIVWVRDDLTTARAAFVKAGETRPDNSEAVAEIFGVSHNVKGQGSSFGFQLMTHLAALEFVIDREIKGDGGEAGQGLLKKLADYIEGEA
jgi:chemotaxis protein histidine kinase CheA